MCRDNRLPMALLRHQLAVLLATWTLLSSVGCLAVPITRDTNANNSTTQNSNNATTMPEEIVLTLTTEDDGAITLHLTRNTNIPSDVPIVVAANGEQTTWTPNSGQFAVYYEMNNSASIVIEMKNQDGQLIKNCRGTVSISGNYYSVQPVDTNFRSYSSEESLVEIDGVDHVMRVEDADLDFTDLIERSVPQNKQSKGLDLRDWPSGFQRYVVEMAMFVDYALYNRWYSRSQAKDHWGRHYDAMLNIQYYFVQVANGVDMRYSTIKESDFSINVRLVGIYVAASASESTWTEGSDVRISYGPAVYSNMYKSLQLFEEWLPTKMSQLGFTFDQATLFTGNNLYDGYYCADGAPCSKSGLGEIGSICKLNAPRALSVTINKEVGMYSSIQTVAHELGHNLGANHDGLGNGCSGSDQYIMASAPSALNANNFDNAFKFSSCSLWYFKNNLARITMEGKGNCLLVGSSSPTVVAPPNFASYPGQQYSADQQCQNIFGSSSYYCAGGGSRDQTICQSMECWVPDKRACYASAEQRASDGTKCGNNKWCMKGKCVYDSRSPAASDTCAYGDYKDRIPVLTGVLMTCYDMGRLQPNSCYLNRTAGDCCQTCASIRDNSKPTGCAYGDKDPDFCRSKAKKSNCYEATFADTCCDTCNRLKSSQVDCEYGDRADWCPTKGSYTCYESGKVCCETCQKFYDSRNPGCEFGDRAPWCPDQVKGPQNCASDSDSKQCCRSCAPYKRNRAAYEACNDKVPWCPIISVDDCYDSHTASTCCSTCSRYIKSMI